MSETRTDVYGYNIRSELISAAKLVGGDDPGAPQTATTEYAYQYDDIGNRITSFDLGTNRTYTANNLNQYTQISNLCDSSPAVALAEAGAGEVFLPQFDDDGNQTLVQTATGIWQVQYNGENRPVLWENVSTNSPTPNSSTPSLISMSFDRMGRRVQYLETCGNATNENKVFIYEGYLQVANFDFATQNAQRFAWDPTEPIATRPLVFYDSSTSPRFYTYDGNKNVTELISSVGSLVAAHYEYASFGTVFLGIGIDNKVNPFRFSSEYDDSHIGVVYYNYRHLNSIYGVWLNRDILEEDSEFGLYHFAGGLSVVDVLGLDGVITIISEKEKRPDDGTSWITYKSDCGRELKDGTKIKKNVEYSFHNYGNNNGLEKKLGLNIGYARKEGRDKNIRHSRTKQIDYSKEDEFFKFIEQSRAKGAKLHTLEHNCAVFASEAWKVATDETIDASNNKSVLETFVTEIGIEKALKRNKMRYLVPMIPKIKNKSMPCPYNLSDAIDAANAPKDSKEQK
jgi:RHS repeat-associated protein